MLRLLLPLSHLTRPSHIYLSTPTYFRGMSSEQPAPVGTQKDPVTGEMISKQFVSFFVRSLLHQVLIDEVFR